MADVNPDVLKSIVSELKVTNFRMGLNHHQEWTLLVYAQNCKNGEGAWFEVPVNKAVISSKPSEDVENLDVLEVLDSLHELSYDVMLISTLGGGGWKLTAIELVSEYKGYGETRQVATASCLMQIYNVDSLAQALEHLGNAVEKHRQQKRGLR